MKRLIRKIIPNSLINLGKHFPTAVLANIKYGFPSRGLIVVGVTGTDGKTTTTNMIYQILKAAGRKTSMVSSINAVIGEKEYDTGFHVTSPSPMDIQKYIKEAKLAGSEILVLEITSHALDQLRAWGIKFDIGVITNITHEHLDYHKSFKNYFKSKMKLVKNVRIAVINQQVLSLIKSYITHHKKWTSGKYITFGMHKSADFNPLKFPLKLLIPGDFNMENAEAAAAVAVNLGVPTAVIKESLNNFRSLIGRMEKFEHQGVTVVIDFAHTPNALENALKTLRKLTKGRLISVFGSASERDNAKRPMMGKISGELADITILTDEDPRYEDRMKILNEIASGGEIRFKEGENLFKEPDRKKAIRLAIKLAKKGDIVGIFGKGHEKSLNIMGVETPWSDQEVVKNIING